MEKVKIEIEYDGHDLKMNRPLTDKFFQWVIFKLAEMAAREAQPKSEPMPRTPYPSIIQ